jgi:hypothetical protein
MTDNELRHGPNTEIRIQGDIVLIKTLRETTIADLQKIFAAYLEVRRKYGYVFALYDGTAGKGMTPEARKEIIASASIPERETNAVATFGAPFPMRALVNVLDRALVTLRRKSLGVVMFATEAEARAYLDGERRKLVTKLRSTMQP